MLMTPPTDQMQYAASSMAQAYEEIGALARGQMDATMKSASAMSRGFEEMTRTLHGMMQENLNRVVTAGKTMMGARTLPEITDTQQELMKDVFESWVAGAGKAQEISTRLTQDVIGPITDHANAAIGKITQKIRA